MNAWVVMKFGGTSVASVDRWNTIAAQAQRSIDAGERPVVVCSALSGVSDRIEAIIAAIPNGHAQDAASALRDQHIDLAHAMGIDAASVMWSSWPWLISMWVHSISSDEVEQDGLSS